MDFGTDYWNSMDKAKELRIDPKQIGISHGVGEVGEGLKANIFRGASVVELGFMGVGKGFRSQPTGSTPESYGASEREEIRQLAKINEIELSTHASPNVGYAAGFNEGVFREEARTNVLHEVKRAIDFAADTAGGGPVVMHLGEFPRPVYEAEEKSFEAYKEEREKSPIYFVDEKTGQARALPRTSTYAVPQYEDKEKKIIKRDPNTQEIQWEQKSLYELEKEYLETAKKTGETPDIAKHLYTTIMAKDLELAEFEERRARQAATSRKEHYETIEKDVKMIKEDPDEIRRKYQLIKFAEGINAAPRKGSDEYDAFLKDPEKQINESIRDAKEEYGYWSEAETTYGRRKEEMKRDIGNVKPITDYGVRQSADTIAMAAMYAYEREKKMELEKPLWVAPENWTPELYGSHPDELRRIIKESRGRMQELLQNQKMSENEAKKVANEHIKATFDIGHLNFWRKYYKGDEDNFKDWVDDQVKGLVKDGIIGHVHLSDNFGYQDEHLMPGEGNAPIQKFVERLKEAKFKGKIITEPGGQKEGQHYRVWTESMKLLGSPIYKIDGATRSWSDIESGYFGRAPQSPYFIVGDYAPSKDWTLWSETPLE